MQILILRNIIVGLRSEAKVSVNLKLSQGKLYNNEEKNLVSKALRTNKTMPKTKYEYKWNKGNKEENL